MSLNEVSSLAGADHSLGYIPSSQKEISKRYQQLVAAQNAPVTQAMLQMPHPTRVFDLNGVVDTARMIFADAAPVVISAAFNKQMSLVEVEMLAIQIQSNPYLQAQYPSFTQLMREVGVGGLFTTLCPLFQNVKADPIFTFSQETCNEVMNIDISKGIDTSFLRAPAPSSYFHLMDGMGLQVHDGVTGFHNLEGFYVYESEEHCYHLDKTTLKALGLDESQPYRALSVVLVGQPKDTGVNDTMSKIDFFVQDGMNIDDMIARTTAWYRGEVIADRSDSDLDLGELSNYAHDSSNLDVDHNVGLLRFVINYLAYLSFASFRKDKSDARTNAVRQVMAKKGSNRLKTAKKISGQVDQIVIKTNNISFASTTGYSTGYKKSPHIRRGFIRNQRYGSGDNVHNKPKFIAPTLVAQDGNNADNIQSKNYIVKS
ncbi:hypothetical protein AAIA71_28700 (plasmid) [Vibrio harveyi]|uniref:hypothetical protein n=1 Tax=Vibrio harveyi TaxID=669 RepID=UPI0031BA1D6D